MIPECLARTDELNKALTQAEDLRDSMLSMPEALQLKDEIAFLDSQIEDLQQKLSDLDQETEKIYQLLRERNNKAYLCVLLHFKTGLKWEEVAEYIGSNEINAKQTAYRYLERLVKEGLIES